MKEYLTFKDYIKAIAHFLPICIVLIMFNVLLFKNNNSSDNINIAIAILSIFESVLLILTILEIKAKERKRKLMMIWKSKEEYKKNK